MKKKTTESHKLIQEFPRIYEDISTTYHDDRFSSKYGGYDYQETTIMIHEIFNELSIDPKCLRVMDVGCGTGKISLPIAKLGAVVVCLDASGGMLAQCFQRARNEGVENQIELLHASADDIPSAENQYDLVVSSRFLHLFPSNMYPIFIEEMLRVVKPKGYVIFEVKNKYYGLGVNYKNEFVKIIKGGTRSSSVSIVQIHQIMNKVRNKYREANIVNIKGCQLPKACNINPNSKWAQMARWLSRSILKPIVLYFFVVIQK